MNTSSLEKYIVTTAAARAVHPRPTEMFTVEVNASFWVLIGPHNPQVILAQIWARRLHVFKENTKEKSKTWGLLDYQFNSRQKYCTKTQDKNVQQPVSKLSTEAIQLLLLRAGTECLTFC